MWTRIVERSMLERKDRAELVTMATALGEKPPARAKKADIVDLILRVTQVGRSRRRHEGRQRRPPRAGGRTRSNRSPSGGRRPAPRSSGRRIGADASPTAEAESSPKRRLDGDAEPVATDAAARPTTDAATPAARPTTTSRARPGVDRRRPATRRRIGPRPRRASIGSRRRP